MQPTISNYLGPIVPVTVMQIGPVGMGMRQGMMVVWMVVRFARRVVLAMHMPVMLIVDVTVGVIENIVGGCGHGNAARKDAAMHPKPSTAPPPR